MPKVPTKMHNKGHAAIQIGSAGGNVTVVNHYHAVAPQSDPEQPRMVRQVMKQKRKLENREWISVLDFAEREFGSRMLKELSTANLGRIELYAEAILRNQTER